MAQIAPPGSATPEKRSRTFVTESLTLMAGTLSSPFFIILYRLWTPVVVSSDNPRMPEEQIRGNGLELRFFPSLLLLQLQVSLTS